ncbi:V8-like Glu-specific endopeptidase [Phytophthora cinnamomi]|uniref:V8-like Glu-specific endopeptidase n=1 Tax=Phytophthora cinnamomi TaxID=4785 RepID=UPI0035599C77|nr:V8-like Glu-specific endopeptidase [Phytophthora cinnamomi]
MLRWNDDVVCTATLVTTNIVLTAAECVLNSDQELREDSQGSSVFSLPQASGIQTTSVVRVHKQSDYWTKWTKNTRCSHERSACRLWERY